jgi:steroid delta-isomerase-like uncharacterized protein
MSAAETRRIVRAYYQAFNKGDTDRMLTLIADDIAHDVNQGETRKGKGLFAEFNAHMTRCYKEKLKDIVIMVGRGGKRASAEFVVDGKYLATDEGLPPANGQKYRLPAGAFFEVADGKITRVTTYYNLKNWMSQVAPKAA